MRKLTFLLVALFTTSFINAQKGVVLSLDFTPGASLAINDEDFDRGRDLDATASFSYDFGFKVGYGFNDKLSLVTGIGFHSHKAGFVHERDVVTVLGAKVTDKNHNKKFSRTLGYVRIPLMLQIGGSGADEGGGFFFRFGPTFNFLTSARYKDDRFVGYSVYDATIAENPLGIDVNKQTDLWSSSNGGVSSSKTGGQGAIYESFVLGMNLDIGGQIRLADNFKMIITLHLETTLTNPEATGAASYANNIRGDVYSSTNVSDLSKTVTDLTPFAATFPNYKDEDLSGITQRAQTFNVFGGLTFGFCYTIPVD